MMRIGLFTLLLFPLFSTAQGWDVLFQDYPLQEARGVARVGSDLLLFGSGYNGVSNTLVTKVDHTGYRQWQKWMGTPTHNERIYSAAPTADGGYILAGARSLKGSSLFNYYLLKVSNNADSLWSAEYGVNASIYSNGCDAVTETPDGGFLIGGSVQVNFIDIAHVIKTDNQGDVEWEYSAGDDATRLVFAVHALEDGSYLIGGDYLGPLSGNLSAAFVTKLSSTGQEVWSQVYQDGTMSSSLRALHPAVNGILLAGYGSNPDNDDFLPDARLMLIDENGDLQWAKYFGSENADFIKDLIPVSDGGWLLMGDNQISTDKQAFMVKLSGGYEEEWTRTLGLLNRQEEIFAVVQGAGGFAAAGTNRGFGSGGYLLYTAFNGGAQVPVEEIPFTSDYFSSVYPNPFVEAATLSLSGFDLYAEKMLEVYSSNGQQVLLRTFTGDRMQLDRNGLPAGLYQYRISENGNVRSAGRFIIN